MRMYFTPKGNTARNKELHNAVSLASNYVTSLNKVKFKPPKNRYRNSTEKWKDDFYFLGREFLIDPEKLVNIISDVSKNSKPYERKEVLYSRALIKMYDLI